MNTLNDLRATLDHHADLVDDDPGIVRVAAVAGRARRVRQQRAAGVAVGAVVAFVGVVSVPMLLDRTPEVPAERQLAGQVAPAELSSLGYTYRFARGVESDTDPAEIRLPRSEEPRLVSWASDADRVAVDVNVEGYSARSQQTSFDDFVLVPGEENVRVTLRAGGADAALAVYELTDDLPAGITERGLTFREQVGSDRLLGAAAGAPGQSEITLDMTVPESRRLRTAEFCDGVPEGEDLWVNVSFDDRGASSTTGCDQGDFDPGGLSNSTWFDPRHLGAPGTVVRVRMWVSEQADGDVVALDGVRLGLGAYEVPRPAAEVAGSGVQSVVEHEGHRWRYVDSVSSSRGDREVRFRNRGSVPVLAIGSVRRVGQATVQVRGGDEGAGGLTTLGSASGINLTLEPGSPAAVLRVPPSVSPRAELGLALYERLD